MRSLVRTGQGDFPSLELILLEQDQLALFRAGGFVDGPAFTEALNGSSGTTWPRDCQFSRFALCVLRLVPPMPDREKALASVPLSRYYSRTGITLKESLRFAENIPER